MDTAPPSGVRDELKAAVETALPQSPGQFGDQLIRQKWGEAVDPQTAMLITLDYDYSGHPAQNGIHQGKIASTRTLLQTLLANYQTVGDGRFGESAFGLYTPPAIGPVIRLVENVDEFANHGSGNHQTYEGIYRQTSPQSFGPETQINLRPADFKKWVWELNLKQLYENYLNEAWPSDEVLAGSRPHPLKTSVKAAFLMSAWLQYQENCLSSQGLQLTMRSAGLPLDQTWDALTIDQVQAPTRLASGIEAGRLKIYRYTASDIWCFRDRISDRSLLYIPGNSSPLHEFDDLSQLREWIVKQGAATETKQALAAHFADEDREDGLFHAGVLTALDGMRDYPRKHRLTKESGFFNNDGYWKPAEYIGVATVSSETDPFAQLVLSMKQAAFDSEQIILDDADVNRANLAAVVEPIVQWVNQFGPLALFVPGGEGLLVLAGMIDAGYGLDQALNSGTASQRSQGVTRTVFGLLNALPLVAGIGSLSKEGSELAALADVEHPSAPTMEAPSNLLTLQPELHVATRARLLRGVGAPAGTFTDVVLAQIGKVSAVDDDMLRLMQAGRAPTPMLADTIDRFRIDQEVAALGEPSTALAEFKRRYQALQQSEHQWVQLFQRRYPDLPRTAAEHMLDRTGVDLTAIPEPDRIKALFKRLDSKARQFQQHVRLNRAYEGLYLRSVSNAESDTLALHSLANLPGWPKKLRVEVLDGSFDGSVLDRAGPIETPDCLQLIKIQGHYQTEKTAAANVYQAVAEGLSQDERSALHLLSDNPGEELKSKVSDHVLSRSELLQGLSRMDSNLAFESQGLRGGGFPATPQAEALTHTLKRLQLKEIYPEFSDAEADVVLAREGDGYLAHISALKRQLEQLSADMRDWVNRVAQDLPDMQIDGLEIGNPGDVNHGQLVARDAALIQDAVDLETQSRIELAEEIIAIWQKRPPQQNSRYAGTHATGFTMDLEHEDFHRLPAFNVRLNDVVGLNMRNLHVTVVSSLDDFLDGFANVQSLDLEDVDLRYTDAGGQLVSELPATIPDLQHLTSLNLRNTQLRLTERTAGRMSELVRLQTLTMADNPLGVPPVVLGMHQLQALDLSNTGITVCPIGIMDQPYLTLLNLRDNQIGRVPQAVLNQAVARGRVLLWNNPITDLDTLKRLVTRRQQTGLNLWLSEVGVNYGDPAVWLRGLGAEQGNARLAIWQQLALKPRGGRFLGAINTLTLTPDFQIDYQNLQARVWRLLADAASSDELWGRLTPGTPSAAGTLDNPFAHFITLEERAKLYADWVALGRPFPIEGNP